MLLSRKVLGGIAASFAVLVMSACSIGGAPQSTPTAVDLNAIYTQVAQTVVAEQEQIAQATAAVQQTEAAQATPTLEPTFTLAFTATTDIGFPTITPLATNAVSALPAQPGCDNLSWVADIGHQDGETFGEDLEFAKIWRVKNTGTCDWTTDYKLAFVAGAGLGNAFTQSVIFKTVKPGETYDITVTIKTPKKKGKNVSGAWRMVNAQGVPFGDTLNCTINVK